MTKQRNLGKKTAALFSQVEKEVTKVTDKRQNYVMDLRVHTPNSLGYRGMEGIDTAPALVRLAKVKGIDVLGVTDFYNGDFVDRVQRAAQDSSVTIIPGVDLRLGIGACEDAEFSCLFPETFTSSDIQIFLDTLNIPLEQAGNSSYRTNCTLATIIAEVEAHKGFVLPTRMDRTPSRRAVIPLLVETYGFRTFDLAHAESAEIFKTNWPELTFHLFSFSNANALAQVGSRIANVSLQGSNFEGIKEVLVRA